ncbi:MAG: ABC transporter ATP-binding protein [Planctomycetes bacterium]|nr:ABC transporter ATP-binding protein [Planctomycetota bacterium]
MTSASAAPVIEIHELSKSYGRVRALDKLSLRVEGGAVGLLGPNGAGKTTLIKLLLGLLVPDSGSARIAGADPRSAQGRLDLRRAVGYMPESDCLIPGMSAIELVATLGELSGLSHADAMTRAHEVLDYVGLDEARYRDSEQYSTGMKQRLKLAQALVHDPALLLLDEPTNGLDPKGRKHMLELVADLGTAQGKSLLVCSHLLPDIERTCARVVVLKAGHAVLEGSIAELTHTRGRRLRAHFAGALEPLDALLEQAGVAVESRNGNARVLVLPESEGDADSLFALCHRAGVRIESLSQLRSSLEQVFLEGIAREEPA